MRLTPRRLNRATLARQMLLDRHALPVTDAVRRLVALQAQEPASPFLALWNRLRDFHPDDLSAAFHGYAVVKAILMRITLHAVAADDRARFHRAMTPTLRAARLNDRRFRGSGLTAADADALVPHLLAFAHRPRRRPEIEGALADRLAGEAHPGVWWALRTIAPLVHAAADEPWSFGRSPAFVAPPATRQAGDPSMDGEAGRSVVPAGADAAGDGPAVPAVDA